MDGNENNASNSNSDGIGNNGDNNSINNSITKNDIEVLYFNARSIRGKFNELQSIIATEKIDLICVTESWTKTLTTDLPSEFDLPEYNKLLKERTNRKGGGIIIYHRDFLEVSEIKLNILNELEIITVNLNFSKIKVILSLIYRPPSQCEHKDRLMYKELGNVIHNKCAIIIGDFNCPEIGRPVAPITREARDLTDFIDDNFLYQKVNEPTRGGNILDLVLTTNDNLIDKLVVREPLGNSDHNMIKFKIKISTHFKSNSMRVPNFNRANFNEFRQRIDQTQWLNILGNQTTEHQWKIFKNVLTVAQSQSVPCKEKRKTTNRNPKWYTPTIGHLIKERELKYKAYKLVNSEYNYTIYNNAKREVKRVVRNAKREYELKIAKESKENPKHFYGYIRNRNPIKNGIGPLSNENGTLEYEGDKICNILNNYFGSVFSKKSYNYMEIQPMTRTLNDNEILRTIEVQEHEIVKYIDKIKVNKAPGPDAIYPIVLKELKSVIAKPLAYIFNQSLRSGVIPEDFKIANVTPIFKKGDKTKASNYRPISLTSIAGKIQESIIRDRIVNHIEEFNLINNTQHGFRNKKSCLTNLLEFFSKVVSDFDEKRAVDIIYLDFRKAFDLVPHDKLIVKLRSLGIDGEVLKWIKEWLNDRKQRVVINGKFSNFVNVTSGVPQGSVLGPILFIIFVNDLDINIVNNISKFADDTKISGLADTIENCQLLQSDLNKISQWSKTWGMQFNVNKCNSLHIGNKNINFDYKMEGVTLEKVSTHKDLGVTVNNKLKFNSQCVASSKMANRVLGFISRSFEYRSKEIILPLYKSLVRPHLEYAVQFWSPYYSKDIDMLERVQRRATKLIVNLRNLPYEDRLKRLGLQTLKTRRLRGELIEVFKILNGFDLVSSELLTLAPQGRTRNNGFKLACKRFRTDVAKNFFANKIVNEWNKFPREVEFS